MQLRRTNTRPRAMLPVEVTLPPEPSRPAPPDLADLAAVGVAASGDLHAVMDRDGTFLWVSEAGAAAFGWRSADLVGQRRTAFIHLDDRSSVEGRGGSASVDLATAVFRFRCGDGSMLWSEAVSRLVDVDGEVLVVWDVRDIGDRRSSEKELRRRATTDPLTGVANRTVFMDRASQALLRLERRRGIVAALVLDLDRFKFVNDTLGHPAGDRVLVQATERLQAALRPGDTLARLGGDEFAVLTEHLTRGEDALALADRLVEVCREPFVVGDTEVSCTTSVGVAVTGDAGRAAHELVEDADLALYRAKGRGRDRAEPFHDDLRSRAIDHLGTERMVRRAVAEGRLRVELQPIVDLRTGATVGAEALVRIWDPCLPDLVRAESFIDAAEQTGVLPTIDAWLLSEVVDQVATWGDRSGDLDVLRISVNVTARALAEPQFATFVLAALDRRGIAPNRLSLELAEHVVMGAPGFAIDGLMRLRDAGVEVGVDNFGNGAASISGLRRAGLDFVKLDRALVQDVGEEGPGRAVVGSIVDLAHALSLEVVAEGVETQAQAHALEMLDCDRAQGYLYGELATVKGGPGGAAPTR